MLYVVYKYKGTNYKSRVFSESEDITLELYLDILYAFKPGSEVIKVIDTELDLDIWPELKETTTFMPRVKKQNILIASNDSQFEFKLGGSRLIYDNDTDRLDILNEDGTTFGGLHCGDRIDVYLDGKWEKSRIERGEDWFIVGLFPEGQIPEGLLVKYGGERILYY